MIQTIGHRGAAALEPENTLRALRRGIELGMDYVEFDVHRCKSGEIVVFHNDTVERTTNGSGRVSEMTLQQLKKLDAGKGERIPTLQEAIEVCKDRVKMQIELKDHGLEREVIDLLIKNGIPEAILISFFHEYVKKAKAEADGKNIRIKTGVILAGNPINVVEMARLANADYVTANHFYMDESMAKKVKAAGLGLTNWTCNTEYDIKKAIKWGADMIASDNPELLNKVLGRKITSEPTKEMVDIVDDADNVLRQVTRDEMHEKSLLHRSANIFVFNSKGEIFVHKRAANLSLYPGMYDLKAGGAAQAGESYENAAKRELKEELGIENARLQYLFDFKFRGGRNNNNRKVYKCVYDGKITLQKEEVESGKFVTMAEAKKILEGGKLSPSAVAVFTEFLKRQK